MWGKHMKFSLLMCVYKNDDPAHFHTSLDSVFHSSVLPDEIILVVDGPIGIELNRVIDLFKSRINLKDIRLMYNVGLGKALSHGIEYCNNEVVARFDSDDVCHPLRFERQLKYMADNECIDVVGSWVAEFDLEPTSVHAYRNTPTSHNEIIKYAKLRNPFNHMSVMFKKTKVLSAGGYQDDYLYEDYSLWVRMITNGCIMKNIPEVLVYARTGNGMEMRRGGYRYLESEISGQFKFYKLGFLSKRELLVNLLVRVPVRIFPGNLRKSIYRNLLRK